MRTSTKKPSSWRRGLQVGLAGLVLTAGGLAIVAPAAGAQTDNGNDTPTQSEEPRQQAPREEGAGDQGGQPRKPQLTDEQRACLEEKGVTKPAEGQRPTEEQREAFKQAADECGIERPQGHGRGRGHGGPKLTDEQRECIESKGVEKPAKGERPTDEQRAAFEAAAEECGIDLPERPQGDEGSRPAPSDKAPNDDRDAPRDQDAPEEDAPPQGS